MDAPPAPRQLGEKEKRASAEDTAAEPEESGPVATGHETVMPLGGFSLEDVQLLKKCRYKLSSSSCSNVSSIFGPLLSYVRC